jgi:hypothetical protein
MATESSQSFNYLVKRFVDADERYPFLAHLAVRANVPSWPEQWIDDRLRWSDEPRVETGPSEQLYSPALPGDLLWGMFQSNLSFDQWHAALEGNPYVLEVRWLLIENEWYLGVLYHAGGKSATMPDNEQHRAILEEVHGLSEEAFSYLPPVPGAEEVTRSFPPTSVDRWLELVYQTMQPQPETRGELVILRLPSRYFASGARVLEMLASRTTDAVHMQSRGPPAEEVAADPGGGETASEQGDVEARAAPAEEVTAHPGGGETVSEQGDVEDLTDRQRLILETMRDHEITSSRRRQTREQIVRLINRTHKPETYGRDFAALVKRQYLRSLAGPKGGVWMTPEGKAEAQPSPSPDGPS